MRPDRRWPGSVFALALVACVSREQRFERAAMARFSGAVPGMKMTVKERLVLEGTLPNGTAVTMNLGNLWAECEGAAEGCDGLERAARNLADSARGIDLKDQAAVRPVLKDARWLASVDETFAAAPPDKQAGNRLVRAPFVADLSVVYVFDSPDGMRMDDRKQLGLAPAALDALARKNLAAALPAALPETELEPGIHLVHAADSYEASRLLLDDLWKQAARAVKGDLLVAAPSRDFVLYTGAGERPEAQARFRALVREYEATRGHALSVTILRRTAKGWQAAPGI
jgi:hypothetical protein